MLIEREEENSENNRECVHEACTKKRGVTTTRFRGLSRRWCWFAEKERREEEKNRPINVIPAYQSEFISSGRTASRTVSGDGEQKRWKKNLVAGRRPRKSAGYVMEVWLKENKQEGHACGTSVGGKGGGERLDAGKGVVVAANACITGERIGNRAASVDIHTHTHTDRVI